MAHPPPRKIKWLITGSDIYSVFPHLLQAQHKSKKISITHLYLTFNKLHCYTSLDKVQTPCQNVHTKLGRGENPAKHTTRGSVRYSPSGEHRGDDPYKRWVKRKIILHVRNRKHSFENPFLKIISQYIHKTESYLLYKRNWAECSPPLPFLLRPVSHYVADYLGLPCNKQQTLRTGWKTQRNISRG